MATAQSKLDILIEAKNNASGTLKQVGTDAGFLEKSLAGVGAGLAAAFSVQAIGQIAQTSYELARAGAESERLSTAYNNLSASAGQNGSAMLAAMQNAAQGTISNTDLMLAANKAMLLGVADSADEMAGLMEVAAARGKAMGLSTSQAFSDIVTGIGRESKMILDNLGIIVDTEAANQTYAESLGVTAEQLSSNERKQALLNQVLTSSAQIVRDNAAAGKDAAAQFESLDSSITNTKEALGQFIDPVFAAGAGVLTSYLDGQVEMLKNETRMLNEAYVAAKNFATGSNDLTIAQLEAARAAGIADAATHSLTFGLNSTGDAAEVAGSKLRAMGADALSAMDAFNVAMGLSNEIASSIESAAASSGALFAGKQGGDAGLARQQQVTSELKAQQKLWEDQGYTQQQIADVLMPGYVSQLREADSATFRVATGTAKISDEARAAQQAFEDLKGTVAGVLQGALDPGVGVNPDDVLEKLGLPREDAINESARRLADIAQNGLKGQDWLGDFANDVPDIWRMIRTAQNPQEEAAYLLRDFQDGLLTAAIDKDKAKEAVRRAMLGDKNMAEMAQEIASELAAEMGVPMQQALAAAQGTLGVGGSLGVGTDAAQGFTDGANANLDETNAGGTFVDRYVVQMRGNFSALRTAGADAAKEWGTSFYNYAADNLSPALISLLATLITPSVESNLAQRGTLTGATP